MLDRDLAELYCVETKRINEAVKRNRERFPDSFCFKLKYSEYAEQRSQIATFNKREPKYKPYAFTEQGVAMLAGVLKSDTAVKISIMIIETFISMRKFIQANGQIFQRLDSLDIKKFESQYCPVEVKVLKNIHDRFIIIDGEVLFFLGASLKDLGKKLFGFTKMEHLAPQFLHFIQIPDRVTQFKIVDFVDIIR